MKKRASIFWNFIKSNPDTLTALIISFIAGFYGVFGGNSNILLSAIAGTLALLSYSAIHDRKLRANLQNDIKYIKQGPSADLILKDRTAYTPFIDTISTARTIYFMGPSLVNIFRTSFKYLCEEKLKNQGAKIQVLFLNPDSPITKYAANCIAEALPERVIEDTQATLRYIKWISDQGVTPGVIEARLMSVNPNLSMIILDPDKPTGRIFLEILGYQTPTDDRPHIELLASRDHKWFNFFLNQFVNLWNDSQKVNL